MGEDIDKVKTHEAWVKLSSSLIFEKNLYKLQAYFFCGLSLGLAILILVLVFKG